MITISILSLYTEGDQSRPRDPCRRLVFQSSPSIQRETTEPSKSPRLEVFQSSPSIQRETDHIAVPEARLEISILSLYTEGDVRLLMVAR